MFNCNRGFCIPPYGKAIFGESDDVANACLRDRWCKAYQYSNNRRYGHLCYSIIYGGIADDYQNCKKIEGKTPNIT